MSDKKEKSYIDLSQSSNVADMVFSLGKSLETGLFTQKNIVLDLGEMELERPQLLGLKALVMGAGSELSLVHTSNSTTKLVALELDIQVVDVKEIEEKQEQKAETLKELVANSNEMLSDILTPSTPVVTETSENLEAVEPTVDAHDELLDNLMTKTTEVPQEFVQGQSSLPHQSSSEVVSGIISQNETLYSDLSANQTPQDEHDELLDNLMCDIKDVKHELGERMQDDEFNKILTDDIAPIESIPPIVEEVAPPAVEPEPAPVVVPEPLPAFVEEEREEKDEEPIDYPKPLGESMEEDLFVKSEDQSSYISDVVDPDDKLLSKEFIIDEKTRKNIVGDTAYIKQTLRSGQVVSFDGNVVIVGNCHSGSEVVAAGDITVWGVLEGIAHAGSKGNKDAVIRALKIDALQLRIASHFARRPDRANIDFAERTDTYTPEEARVKDGRIYIYTLNTEGQN